MENKPQQQREIRFRAFLEIGKQSEIKVMLDDITVYPEGRKLGINHDNFVDSLKEKGWDWDGDAFTRGDESITGYEWNVIQGDEWVFFDAKLMQFTGLKDCNGKDVYEGDIVKVKDHPTGVWDLTSDVCYERGQWRVRGSLVELSNYGTAWTEVIGDIYSTPHLLERETNLKKTNV